MASANECSGFSRPNLPPSCRCHRTTVRKMMGSKPRFGPSKTRPADDPTIDFNNVTGTSLNTHCITPVHFKIYECPKAFSPFHLTFNLVLPKRTDVLGDVGSIDPEVVRKQIEYIKVRHRSDDPLDFWQKYVFFQTIALTDPLLLREA